MRRLSTFKLIRKNLFSMIKNNYKNTILTSMIALTLLTSVIAVGGIQNAYAGVFIELDCTVEPLSVEIDLAAGEESDELSKVIDCNLEVPFVVNIQVFNVADFEPECPLGIEVNLSEPIIDQDSLSAQYLEIIEVLEGTEPGPYHCVLDFEAVAFGDVFFCDFLGNLSGPLTEGEINECVQKGGELEIEFFEAVGPFLEQTIWVEVLEPEPEILVHIDIKPQSCPNPVNINSRGLLPVAILGNEVDVSQIDVDTTLLAGVSPIRHDVEDVATPHTPDTAVVNPNDCTIDGPDGVDDLTLKFDTQQVLDALDVSRGDVIQVLLTGNLLDGTVIHSYDVIIVR